MQLDRHARTAKILTGALCILAALLLIMNQTSLAGGRSDTKVKATASAGPIDATGKQSVTLTLTIAKDWHIYANPVKCEDFDSIQTTVKVIPKVKLAKLKIDYPPRQAGQGREAEARIHDL